ncbi:nuclear protein localization protein 4 [Basidiobolus ranarum]|uniref:Nuclear protein localization protein 4 n=1 Tax=Basidiobolus ranarum TaxID=34480 RepID=A0ABR2W7J8_9FUNG
MNVLKTIGIRYLSELLISKAVPKPKLTVYQSCAALLLPLLPTVFQYWAFYQRKSKATLRTITLLALILQGWVCITFSPKGLVANLMLKGGSIFFAFRVMKLGVLAPPSVKKKIGVLEYYRMVFALVGPNGKATKKPRNKRTFLWYLMIVIIQYLAANLIRLYFRYQPLQTELTIRSLLSLKEPEFALQQYLYVLLVYLYVSIYHFVLVYPWCFLTGAQYTAIFNSSPISKQPKSFWKVRWNKVFQENFRNGILEPITNSLVSPKATSRKKNHVYLFSGFCALFGSSIVHELLAMLNSNSPPTIENIMFILVHGGVASTQVGLEKILGKNILPEKLSALISNTFLILVTPLLVSPLSQVIDIWAPPIIVSDNIILYRLTNKTTRIKPNTLLLMNLTQPPGDVIIYLGAQVYQNFHRTLRKRKVVCVNRKQQEFHIYIYTLDTCQISLYFLTLNSLLNFSNSMLLRIRSPEGTSRVQIDGSEDISIAIKKLAETLKCDPSSINLSGSPEGATLFPTNGATIDQLGLKHGDMLYALLAKAAEETRENKEPTTFFNNVKQDPVDDYLDKQDGLIKRGRDSNFCKHGSNGMCDYCMPLEPFDANYLEENRIKHMSFHAYLRQLNVQNKKSGAKSSYLPPLEEPNYKVDRNCKGGHPPWPESICTKCQPSAITLQRQSFRMVDHVEFSSASLIDNFINYWRSTGSQRFGYLYGRYEPYNEVPLGIKAVVEAIYEPPQTNESDGLTLTLPWNEEKSIDELAAECGLIKVGMIYTDLLDDGTGQGKVVCKRHIDSYFLSSLEITFTAAMQAKNPNPSKWSASGQFASKFVTCVVSGNETGDIDVSSYQVSNTCMAMVEADIIEPSIKPSVMRVKEATSSRYVPEVFYKYKNEYGVTVSHNAKPSFPVEYLLVNVTHGFPSQPNPLFTSSTHFPIENRTGLEVQELSTLQKYLTSTENIHGISNFHMLAFIQQMNVLEKMDLSLLCKAASTHSEVDAKALESSPGWQTLFAILRETDHGGHTNPGTGSSSSATQSTWPCRHCTFVNPSNLSSCEMCGLPKDQ